MTFRQGPNGHLRQSVSYSTSSASDNPPASQDNLFEDTFIDLPDLLAGPEEDDDDDVEEDFGKGVEEEVYGKPAAPADDEERRKDPVSLNVDYLLWIL